MQSAASTDPREGPHTVLLTLEGWWLTNCRPIQGFTTTQSMKVAIWRGTGDLSQQQHKKRYLKISLTNRIVTLFSLLDDNSWKITISPQWLGYENWKCMTSLSWTLPNSYSGVGWIITRWSQKLRTDRLAKQWWRDELSEDDLAGWQGGPRPRRSTGWQTCPGSAGSSLVWNGSEWIWTWWQWRFIADSVNRGARGHPSHQSWARTLESRHNAQASVRYPDQSKSGCSSSVEH